MGSRPGPDGDLWFTEGPPNQIGRVTVSSSGLTISPASALPTITEKRPPGPCQYAARLCRVPLIELDGTDAGGANGLTVNSANDGVIRGFTINRFGGDGIRFNGASRWLIAGNFIGTDSTGTLQRSNALDGVLFNDFSADNTIGGTSNAERNVISGNGSEGVQIQGLVTDGNLVIGNFVGTDQTGTLAVPNALSGVILNGNASGNSIGGAAPGAGNVISGNLDKGIRVLGTLTTDNVIQGNQIGTDVTGKVRLWNANNGVVVDDAPRAIVGGSNAGEGNLISWQRQQWNRHLQ